jgi:tyrosine phenol-lyase
VPLPTPLHEPHKIKTVRLLAFPTLEERKQYLSRAHFNTFNLTPSQVTFDMCSLGTSAMSQDQLAGQLDRRRGLRRGAQLRDAGGGREPGARPHLRLPDPQRARLREAGRRDAGAAGSLIPSNATTRLDTAQAPRGIEIADVRDRYGASSPGTWTSRSSMSPPEGRKVAIVGLQASPTASTPSACEPAPSGPRRPVRQGSSSTVSRVIENAWYIQRHERGRPTARSPTSSSRSPRRPTSSRSTAPRTPSRNTGGILTTDNPDDHEKFMNEVVVYEGLHTYGGMAGPDDGGPRARHHGDVRRGRGPVGHAPDRAVHARGSATRASRSSAAATAPTSRPTSSSRTSAPSPQHALAARSTQCPA